ncbi:MAG: glycosyltransferase family 29 protein [Sphingobium sp.]|nr:glycosyltransferase family 29 protein [Sphingobium sp.]
MKMSDQEAGNFFFDAVARKKDKPASIAVIGNSPRLGQDRNGERIDAHDVIIRVNDGRTTGFEEFGGSRTDIRFVGVPLKERYWDFFRELDEPSTIITRVENEPVLKNLGYAGEPVYYPNRDVHTHAALPILSRYVETGAYPKKPPRSGIVILSFLSPFFEKGVPISLFGFEIEPRKGGEEHYYKDGRDFGRALQHWDDAHCPMEVEFAVLGRLRDKGYIRFF